MVYKDFYELPDKIRNIVKDYIDGKDMHGIAQKVRAILKILMSKCFSEFR